jgi:hypothetical protein
MVKGVLKWEDWTATIDAYSWESDGAPPDEGKTVFVSPRKRGGAPKAKPDHTWDARFSNTNQILHPTFEWTTNARLTSNQSLPMI